MKKILLYTVALAMGISSCSGFLDEEPKLSQSNELTFSDFDGLDKATAGAYTRLNSSSWYGGQYILLSELAGGNAKNPVSFPGSGRYLTQSYWSFNESSTSSAWGYCYYTIAAVNNVLSNLEGKTSTEVTQEQIDNLQAECLFLRSLCYLDLVSTYGVAYTKDSEGLGVPVVLVTENGKPARNTVKEVYDQIVTDLTTAESLISDDYTREDATDAGAVASKSAIQALLSRTYLYMGEWQKSADYATKVINSGKYNLMSGEDYLGMFTAATAKSGGEVIFEMYSYRSNSYWDDSGWTMNSYITSADGSADVCASSDLINLFSDGDIRLSLYSLQNNTDWFCLKYAGKTGSSAPKENNTIILRLSEMYLNRAEAIYNGAVVSGVTAQSDLNTLASYRGTTAESPSRTTIFNERRRELAFEGHIFYDCKRTQTSVVRTDNGGENMDGTSARWALPIPKAEIDANPNIVQNEY